MIGYKKIGHFRILCNYRELLIRALKVNSPLTNTPPPHVVHKNPTKWPPRVWSTFHRFLYNDHSFFSKSLELQPLISQNSTGAYVTSDRFSALINFHQSTGTTWPKNPTPSIVHCNVCWAFQPGAHVDYQKNFNKSLLDQNWLGINGEHIFSINISNYTDYPN